jgi:hypothetical protein
MNCFFFSGLSCVNLWTGGQAGLAISYYFATFSILKQKRQQTAGNSFAAVVSYNPELLHLASNAELLHGLGRIAFSVVMSLPRDSESCLVL